MENKQYFEKQCNIADNNLKNIIVRAERDSSSAIVDEITILSNQDVASANAHPQEGNKIFAITSTGNVLEVTNTDGILQTNNNESNNVEQSSAAIELQNLLQSWDLELLYDFFIGKLC